MEPSYHIRRENQNAMNSKVFVIILLTLSALVVLYLYSFGPLANSRNVFHPNPQSLKPVAPKEKIEVGEHHDVFMEYHNRDMRENYYGVSIPQTWQVKSGTTPGSYSFSSGAMTGSIALIDVPDNSTLELFVLSREEPKLKKEIHGYSRVNYRKLDINGNVSYELEYSSDIDGNQVMNSRTYITGQDQAGVITFSARKTDFESISQSANAVVMSIKWENQ